MASSEGNAMENLDDCHYFYEDEVYRLTSGGNVQFGMVVENSEFVSSGEEEEEEEAEQEQQQPRRQSASRRSQGGGGRTNRGGGGGGGGDDDADDDDRLRRGFVRVAWHPKGEEEVVKESKLNLADRSLMPGDVVRRMVRGKDTQRGYCRKVDVAVAGLVVGGGGNSNQVVVGLDSARLRPLEAFTPDVVACLDNWVGIIKEVVSDVHLKFRDGTVCVLQDIDAELLEDLGDTKEEDCEFRRFDFYPGQVLSGPFKHFKRGTFSEVGSNVESLRAGGDSKRNKETRATVFKVVVTSVQVHWQCRGYSKAAEGEAGQQQPPLSVAGEDLKRLKMLNVFAPCTMQIGDKSLYTLGENDVIMTKEDWRKLEKQQLKAGRKTSSKGKKASAAKAAKAEESHSEEYDEFGDDDDEEEAVANHNHTDASGQQKSKRPAAAVGKPLHSKRQKLKKSKANHANAAANSKKMLDLKPGDDVVVETLCTKSEAEVVWQDGAIEPGVPSTELFPIHHLDDQEFFCGDFVVRGGGEGEPYRPHEYGVVQEVDHAGRTCRVKWFETYSPAAASAAASTEPPAPKHVETTEEPVYDLRDHPDFRFRPGSIVIRVANFGEAEVEGVACCGGQVLDNYTHGQVKVWWADESTSFCWPQDLYRIGEYDSDEEGGLWSDDGHDGESDASWETESEHSVGADSGGAMSVEDDVRTRLAADIQRVRDAMSRMEEKLTEKAAGGKGSAGGASGASGGSVAPLGANTMRHLLEVYRECKAIDRLLGTDHFDEAKFEDGLVEKLRARSNKMGNAQQAMAEHVAKFQQPHQEDKDKPAEEGASATAAGTDDSFQWQLSERDRVDRDDRQLCARLCSRITEQLVKCHDDAVRKYGGQNALFSPEDLAEAPGEAAYDLEGIMGAILGATREHLSRQLASLFNPFSRTEGRGGGGQDDDGDADDEDDERGQEEAEAAAKARKDSFSSATSPPSKATGVTSEEISTALYGKKKEEEDESAKTGGEGSSSGEKSKDGKPEEGAVGGVSDERPKAEETAAAQDDEVPSSSFTVAESSPATHKFRLSLFQPKDPKGFIKFVRKEVNLLRTSLPSGIAVKAYEDRMDLYSVMITGPAKTPYEGGLFFFDFQLSSDYPQSPPQCQYYSYCTDRLNPNLYEDGKVCVSLLGTWSGKGTETWTPNSNMLQLLVSIQGLILVAEPYYNEAGYERQRGTQQGRENSRMYNEMALLKMVQSMTKVVSQHEGSVFKEEIRSHFERNGPKLIERLERWREISMSGQQVSSSDGPTEKKEEEEEAKERRQKLSPASRGNFFLTLLSSALQEQADQEATTSEASTPDFPLLPVSKGFCISLAKTLRQFKDALRAAGIGNDGAEK